MKLINNYKNKFSELYKQIKDIRFEKNSFNIYELWGIFAIVLGFNNTTSITQASKTLENNTMLFLGERGPRIDYKITKTNNVISLQVLKTLQSAISFKLAGIDDLSLSYGIIESFVEFLSNEIDNLKETMGVEAVAFSGSLFENNKLFAKTVKEVSSNHKIYFNNQLHIDKNNLFYVDKIN
jgi:hydrogenase maturation factor HypF (carbamoyltransferase family)